MCSRSFGHTSPECGAAPFSRYWGNSDLEASSHSFHLVSGSHTKQLQHLSIPWSTASRTLPCPWTAFCPSLYSCHRGASRCSPCQLQWIEQRSNRTTPGGT